MPSLIDKNDKIEREAICLCKVNPLINEELESRFDNVFSFAPTESHTHCVFDQVSCNLMSC